MARSQSNLQVGIGIDTSKFVADAAIVKNELRSIKREVDAAAKAGDVPRLQAAAQQQSQLTNQYIALQRAIRGTTQAQTEAVPVFTQMSGAFSLLHSKTLLVTGAITAAGFAIFKLANNAAKSTDELEDNAAALGIAAGKLQALQLVAARAGGSADDLVQGLSRFVRTLGDAQTEEDKLLESVAKAAPGFDELGNSLTQTTPKFETHAEWSNRLAEAYAKVDNVFTRLNINISQFPRTAAGTIQAYQAVAREISKLADSPIKAARAAEIFGKGWRKQIEILADLNTTLPQAENALQEAGLISGKTAKDQSEAWLASFNTLSTTFSNISTQVGNTIGTALVPVFNDLNAFLVANRATFVSWGQFIGAAITEAAARINTTFQELRAIGAGLSAIWNGAMTAAQSFGDAVGAVATSFQTAWQAAFDWFGGAVNTVLEWFDWIIAKAKDAWSWIVQGAAAAAGSVSPTAAAAAGASGGYVRGPGTGTSDSILARLSNGEFVINAASVRRLGVGFLHGLNQFAAGGLVGMPPIRFAEGGLAAAAGGTPVHLHLGNRSFALAGQAGVVKALVSEAHAQQVRSAGVKPSWFAGRPSGR